MFENVTAFSLIFLFERYIKIMSELTQLERTRVVNEIKMNIIANDLENEIASKVLYYILNDYIITGKQYNKELTLNLTDGKKRKIVVKLYNNKLMKDTVLIKQV